MEDDDTESTSPLAVLAGLGTNYTTSEAHRIARGIIKDYQDGSVAANEEQDAAAADAEAAARRAQEVLRAARQRIQNLRYGDASTLAAISAGLGAPTKSGAFSESISNAATNIGEVIKDRRKWSEGRDANADTMGVDIEGIDQKIAASRAAMVAKRRELEQKGFIESLKIMGREIRPNPRSGAQGMSPFGKIAKDEGLIEGTPEFIARVNALYNADMKQRQQAAGVDVEEASPDRERNLSDEMGIPYQIRDPFENYSTKQRQAALESRQKEAAGRLKEVGDATGAARQAIQDMDRFMQLNKDTPTGPIVGRLWPETLLSESGQEMRSITARQSRNMRVPGEGPMSNYDARQLTLAAVSTTKSPKVNENIARGAKAVKGLQLQYNRFLNDYNVARGHLVGADQAWQQYIEDNPIFDASKPDGSFILNPTRLPYRDYFRRKNAEHDAPAGDEMSDEQVGAGLTPEQIAAAKRPAKARGGQVYADGGTVKKQKSTGLQRLLRSMEQGATFNFGDEINASASPVPYEDAIKDERRILEETSGEHPVGMMAGEMAGSVPAAGVSTYLGARGLGALRARGKLGKLLKLIPKSQLGRMVISGGATGAVAGAGASQGDSAAGDVASGAVVGAVAGPLAGFAAKYGVRGTQRIWDFVTGKSMNAADRKIVEAALRDDVNLRDAVNQVVRDNKAGIPSTLTDVGGRNMQGLAENVAKRSGEGPDEMLDHLEGRLAGSHERVTEQVNKGLAPDDYHGKLEELKDQLYSQAKPLYEKAYAENPAVKTDVLSLLHGTDAGQKAIDRAIESAKVTAALSGRPLEQVLGKYDPINKMITKPSLEFLDHVKRSLDGMINVEERTGATDIGHGLRALRSRLMTTLDDPSIVSDTYREARKQYAGDLEVLQALEMGKENFLRLSPNDLKQAMANMSFAERDALRTGVAESLFNRVGATAEHANPATRIIGTPGMVDKLSQLFDTPAAFAKFQGALIKEAGMFDRSKRMVNAGRSARVAAGNDAPSSARDLLVSGGLTAMAPGVEQMQPGWYARMGNVASRALSPMRQETIDDIARTMSSTDPAKIGRPADALQAELDRLTKLFKRSNRAALTGSFVGGSSVGPDPYGYTLDEEEPANPGAEDEGYASGGLVDLVGMSDPRQSLGVTGQTIPSSPYVGGGVPGQTYGTDAARTRATLPAIDYEHYGEGPEQSFFDRNSIPDAKYTTAAVPTAQSASSGNSSGASTAGGIGTLLGAAAKIPKVISTAKDIGSLLGIGAGAVPAGALAEVTGAGLPTLAEMAGAGGAEAAATLGGVGAGEAAGAAGTGAGAGAGFFGGAGLGASLAGGALLAAPILNFARIAMTKEPAGVTGGYETATGLPTIKLDPQYETYMQKAGISNDALMAKLSPLLQEYAKTGDRDALRAAITKPEGYQRTKNSITGINGGTAGLGFGKNVDPTDAFLYYLLNDQGLNQGKGDILGSIDKAVGRGG